MPPTTSAVIAALLSRDVELRPVIFLADGAAVASVLDVDPDGVKSVVIIDRKVLGRQEVIQIMMDSLHLSARQADIAYRLTLGESKKIIANALGVTPHTVMRHAEAIYLRLRVNSVLQLEAKLVAAVEEHMSRKSG